MQKQRIAALALSLMLSLGMMAGCTNAPQQTPPPASAAAPQEDASQPASKPVNLKWALWDINLVAYYQPLIDAYVAQNPNVTIEMVDLGAADYMTMLSTQLSGGSDLDVLTIKDIPGYANLVRQNHLEPLSDYINKAGIDVPAYGGLLEQLQVNAEVYQIPFRSDFWIVYYNKDLFDAAGVDYPTNDMTYEQYEALARKMTSGSGSEKVFGTHYHTWRSTVQLFGAMDGKHTLVDGTYDFLKPYYDQVLQLQKDGIVQDYATLQTSSTHYSGVFFNNQTAMMHMGSWFIATQIDKVKSGESLSTNWGIVKFPHPEGVAAGTAPGTITGLAVNANSKNKEAALDFMKFVTSSDGAKIIAQTGTIPSIVNSEVMNMIASMDGFPTDAGSKEALNTVQTYLEMPLHEKSADIEVALNECHTDIMTGNTTVEEGIANMNARVGALLN